MEMGTPLPWWPGRQGAEVRLTDVIERARRLSGETSAAGLARRLDISRSQLSHYKAGTDAPGESVCLRLARLAHCSPALVLALAAARRATDEADARAWADVAEGMARLAGLHETGAHEPDPSAAPTGDVLTDDASHTSGR